MSSLQALHFLNLSPVGVAAPLNVNVVVLSSTMLEVSWDVSTPLKCRVIRSTAAVIPQIPDLANTNLPVWSVELFLQEKLSNVATTSLQSTNVVFGSLNKGTEYRVRVHGVNSAGPGTFSAFVSAETDVDREFKL
jgi:hypothetical protein